MSLYTSLAILLFSALALVVPSGFSLGAVMLLAGSVYLIKRSARRFSLGTEDKILILVFALYFVVNSAINLMHHAPGAEYDPPSRFLLAIPALLLLLAYPPRPAAFWAGLAVGGIGAVLLSIWQLKILHLDRPGGSTNPIQYGNIAMVLAITCACGISWAKNQRRAGVWILLLIVGAASGLAASFISGSRGSWIAAPVCVLPALIMLIRDGNGAMVRNLIAAGVVVIAALWMIPQTGIKNRIEQAVTEGQAYAQKNDTKTADTSVGARLEMWRVGVLIAPERLALGWGKEGMMKRKAELVEQGLAAPIVLEHTHLHNEYLDALVKRGIPGLLVLLILYGTPLALFARHLRDGPQERRYALAGLMLMLSYIAFGLTQAFMTHNNGVMILAFMTAALWAQMRTAQAGTASAS
ncbi:O-antigen ligase family protein [Herbaspirillum sp.]|uniref:O-antigen ligase family protein n=1 Tax=Herbaspirillum sp. TaxID=1890675 RepID=UPI001B09E6D9|nr:O-antigen ligase family protein [Herbaspirillum sp.]MBO9537991.1 O-antigen ligase family protein [Herbaspirillum sp.]